MAKASRRAGAVDERDPASRDHAALNFQVIELRDHIVQELRKAGRFTIPGFGTFTIRGTNASTRAEHGQSDLVNMRDVKTVWFEASPILEQAIELVDPGPPGRHPDFPQIDDPMARQLSEGFAEAARQAVREAHAEGLAVPARKGGVAVEIRPGGEVVPIDEKATWSPTDWRTQAKH